MNRAIIIIITMIIFYLAFKNVFKPSVLNCRGKKTKQCFCNSGL